MNALSTADLSALPALAGYPPDELDVLLTVAKAREIPAGEALCSAGDAGRSCFLVVSGAVEITKPGATGVLAVLGPGTFVGQMALVDHAPRSATVTASEPSRILEFAREPFERLLAARSPLALRFQEQIAIAGIRQLRQATERLGEAIGRGRANQASVESSRAPGASNDDMLRYIQAATAEWDLDLQKIEFVHAEGEIPTTEAAARRRLR